MNYTQERVRLKRKIMLSGIKKNHIARKSNMSPVYLSYLLNGQRTPKNLASILKKISKVVSQSNSYGS